MPTRSIVLCLAAFVAATASAGAAEPPAFGPAVEISPPLPHPYYTDPDVAVRGDRAVAVWNKARFGKQSWVQAAELGVSGQPGPVTSIVASTNSGWDNDPSIALSSGGRAAVTWEWSGHFGTPSARLSILDADLATGPAQWLGEGYDPVVGYPEAGDGLIVWSGAGELATAPIDPLGAVGAEGTIPFEDEALRATDPTVEPAPDGMKVYWGGYGVFETPVDDLGEPGATRTVLPPLDYGYRNLVVSGDLLVAIGDRGRRIELTCVPLAGGPPKTIDSGRASDQGPIRIGSVDVDIAGSHGLIGWVRHRRDGGKWVAKAATVDDACRVTRTVSLPSPGRRAYDTQVGHDGSSPLALVAGGGGLESVGLSRSGKVRASTRVANTKPLSHKVESRNPVSGLELVTEPGSRPTAVWSQTHRGPGATIAASVAR